MLGLLAGFLVGLLRLLGLRVLLGRLGLRLGWDGWVCGSAVSVNVDSFRLNVNLMAHLIPLLHRTGVAGGNRPFDMNSA